MWQLQVNRSSVRPEPWGREEESPMTFNLASQFYEQASVYPAQLALSVGGVDLSYSELANRVQRIAGWLGNQSRKELSLVGILASRSVEAYTGILGTCWAGAAYVPLNPKLPEERLLRILETTELDALIADEQGLKLLSPRLLDNCPQRILAPGAPGSLLPAGHGGARVIAGQDDLPVFDPHDKPQPLTDDHLAYLMFTSGTTGVPKGVMLSVGNVRHLLSVMQDRYHFRPEDRVSQTFELTFDLSVFDMFMTWGAGASLHVVPATQLMGPLRFIQQRQLTIWFSVPSTAAFMGGMKMLKPGAMPSLRYSLFCGEPLPFHSAEMWQQAAPQSILDNLYGPTEATVACLVEKFRGPANVTPKRGIVAIGKPFVGMEAAIVDSALSFLPPGQEGELALSGKQLAKGYFKDPAQTAARFRVLDGKRWYLTGDLAYQDTAGTFHHLGRIDHQVKILGNRVELEEVEAHLREICGSDSVAAVAWPVENGLAQGIRAFVSNVNIAAAQVREEMRRRLPSYMVPSQVQTLSAMPLTASGKVDRKALVRMLEQKQT